MREYCWNRRCSSWRRLVSLSTECPDVITGPSPSDPAPMKKLAGTATGGSTVARDDTTQFHTTPSYPSRYSVEISATLSTSSARLPAASLTGAFISMYPDAAGIGTDTNAVVRLFPDAMQKTKQPADASGSELCLLFYLSKVI